MEQTITVKVPEGKKAVYNETTQTIEFVNIGPQRSESWQEYCKNHKIETRYQVSTRFCPDFAFNKADDTLGIVALSKLKRLHDEWVGDWKPSSKNFYYTIVHEKDDFCVWTCSTMTPLLTFPTKEMATHFRKCFLDLLKEAKMFI